MKGKLALLALLSTVVTVGSVYATWTFAEKTTPAASTTVNIAMTGTTSDTEKGTLSIKAIGDPSFTMAIDDANNDHLPELMKIGSIVVEFTPSASASEDVKTNGINIITYATYAPYTGGPATIEEWTYGGKQIFEIQTTKAAARHLKGSEATYDSVNKKFVWTIPAANIGIKLTDDFDDIYIDTLDKYDDLNAELAKGHFVLNAEECTVVHS